MIDAYQHISIAQLQSFFTTGRANYRKLFYNKSKAFKYINNLCLDRNNSY